MNNRTKGVMFAVIAAFTWGFLAISLKVALDYVPALTIVWVRFVLAFLVLWLILFFREKSALQVLKKPPLLAIVAAVALAGNYIGYIKGLDLTSPSNAQIVIQLAPLLLIVVGFIIYKERINLLQGLGFLCAITGFGLFYRDQISQLVTSTANYNTGIAWVVGAAISWVVFASLQKSLVQKHHAQGLNLLIYLVPAILIIPMADFDVLLSLDWKLWALLVFLGLNTILAYGAIAEAFRFIPANKVGIIVTLNPIVTIVTMGILTTLGVTWIDPERISIFGFAGAALIVTGVVIAILVQRKPEKEQNAGKESIVKEKLNLGLDDN